jgi:hypothetical protein
MRIAAVVAAVVAAALVLAGCGAGKTVTTTVTSTKTVTVRQPPQSSVLGVQDTSYFGQITSITQADPKRYLLVLKPELFLVGVTANVVGAQQQGKQCAPLSCPGVEDDHLVLPAGTQALTFVLPATTTGTVLMMAHGNMQSSKVSAAQLAALVGGAKTPKLIEPLDSGLWLAVNVDKVTSFAQQFQP